MIAKKRDKVKERVTKFSILIRCKINTLELINLSWVPEQEEKKDKDVEGCTVDQILEINKVIFSN